MSDSINRPTHVVTFTRFDEDVVYTLGTYSQKLAEKLAVQLANRADVRTVGVRAIWEPT